MLPNVAADEQRSAAENLFFGAECLLQPLVRPACGRTGGCPIRGHVHPTAGRVNVANNRLAKERSGLPVSRFGCYGSYLN